MAATRKSAKRSAAKKSAAAKRPSKKKAVRKSASKGRARKTPSKATGLKRQAKKGLKVARGGFDSVMEAGGKTWESLKSTTANAMEGMVEGVKDTFAGDPPRRPNSR